MVNEQTYEKAQEIVNHMFDPHNDYDHSCWTDFVTLGVSQTITPPFSPTQGGTLVLVFIPDRTNNVVDMVVNEMRYGKIMSQKCRITLSKQQTVSKIVQVIARGNFLAF